MHATALTLDSLDESESIRKTRVVSSIAQTFGLKYLIINVIIFIIDLQNIHQGISLTLNRLLRDQFDNL